MIIYPLSSSLYMCLLAPPFHGLQVNLVFWFFKLLRIRHFMDMSEIKKPQRRNSCIMCLWKEMCILTQGTSSRWMRMGSSTLLTGWETLSGNSTKLRVNPGSLEEVTHTQDWMTQVRLKHAERQLCLNKTTKDRNQVP